MSGYKANEQPLMMALVSLVVADIYYVYYFIQQRMVVHLFCALDCRNLIRRTTTRNKNKSSKAITKKKKPKKRPKIITRRRKKNKQGIKAKTQK